MNRRGHSGLAALAAVAAFVSPRGVASPVRADTPPPLADVWTFGRNRVGQLGSVPPNTTIPWPVHAARRWVAVSAGTDHTLALTDQGEVFAWGNNESGQLGTGGTATSIVPIQVSALTGVTGIAAGGQHSLAYRASDRALWGWGSNSEGQIAQPSSVAMSPTPVPIVLGASITALAAGGAHSLALDADGVVYGWGENLLGQLGLGDVQGRFSPVPVPLAGPAIAIAAGAAHSLAVTSGDGQVWTWGWNVFGGLGNGKQGAPDEPFSTPAKALGVTGVDQVSAGSFHSLARTVDGHVWAWGYNTEGQVGNGAVTPANTGVLTPVLLDGIDSIAALDAGSIHSIALGTDGTVWTWGSNQFGACGTNGRDDKLRPVRASGLRGSAVSAGGSHSVVLAAPAPPLGLIELGDPEAEQAPASLPLVKPLDGPTDVIAVAAGSHHGLAIDGQRRIWSWGDDSNGQLGTNDGARAAPELVDVPFDGTAGFVEVAARADQSFALRSDGAVFAWGDNTYGQLGLGIPDGRAAPTVLVALSRIVAMSAGERHGLALDQDATVWAWGQNLHGELGTTPSAKLARTPVQIPGLYGITYIAAGGFHSAALDLVGTLSLWGDGSRGQLGTGGIVGGPAIVSAALPHDVTMVSLGRFHTLALRTGGVVSAFGDASACQLGTGNIPGVWTPAPAAVPDGATLVNAGEYHGLAVTGDGKVYGWGDDSEGALGTEGPTFSHLTCVPGTAAAPAATLAAAGGPFSVLAAAR